MARSAVVVAGIREVFFRLVIDDAEPYIRASSILITSYQPDGLSRLYRLAGMDEGAIVLQYSIAPEGAVGMYDLYIVAGATSASLDGAADIHFGDSAAPGGIDGIVRMRSQPDGIGAIRSIVAGGGPGGVLYFIGLGFFAGCYR